MKTKTSIIAILSGIMFVFMAVGSGFSQNFSHPDQTNVPETRSQNSMIVITEDDYSCFRSIECLKNNEKYQDNGWNILFDTNIPYPKEYVLKGEFRNENLSARYNRNGILVESTFQRKNTVLPSVIRRYIVTGDLAGWTMTANEMIVNDFEVQKTEYKVVLEKDGGEQVLYFDHEGNRVERLAGR